MAKVNKYWGLVAVGAAAAAAAGAIAALVLKNRRFSEIEDFDEDFDDFEFAEEVSDEDVVKDAEMGETEAFASWEEAEETPVQEDAVEEEQLQTDETEEAEKIEEAVEENAE